jgi:hypothetical protein
LRVPAGLIQVPADAVTDSVTVPAAPAVYVTVFVVLPPVIAPPVMDHW